MSEEEMNKNNESAINYEEYLINETENEDETSLVKE
jgi:hypothetical protein